MPSTSLSSLGLALFLASGCDPGTATPADADDSTRTLFVLEDLAGDEVDVGAEQAGDILVLVFWATWCQPCQSELAELNPLHDELGPRGLRLLALNTDAPATLSNVAPWVAREGYRFEVLMDTETQILKRYNPPGEIPYYVVVDGSGRVLRDHQTYNPGDVGELRAYLEPILPR